MQLEPLESVDAARDVWAELAAAGGNVFATPEWHELWLARHAAEPRLTAVLDDAGAVRAILPLVLERRAGLRVLRCSGHGPGDENGPVCAPGARGDAVAGLRELLARGGHDVFLGEQLPAWAAVGAPLSREGSPVLRLGEDGWDGLLARRSRNFREQVRRRERKLGREHEVAFRLSDAERLDGDLSTLFALHRARWRGRPTAFAAEEPFHREVARRFLELGRLRLWLLELDGAPAAAWLGFRYAGAESYYQLGRDPAWDDASVGFVLLCHTIRAAAGDGIAEYRFLRGDEPYKYRFADDDPGLVTVGRGGTALGSAALRGAVAARALRSRLRAGLRIRRSG